MLRLKEVLDKRKMSQRELSSAIGKSVQTISSWAQNKSEPSLKTALKICEVLNVKINELVAEKEFKK
jgi:DNA-binding XRE family transcriptional regulator